MVLGRCQICAEVHFLILLMLGKPLPSYIYTQIALPALIKVMSEQSDPEILTDSLWALSYLTDGDEEQIEKILSLNIIFGLSKNLRYLYL